MYEIVSIEDEREISDLLGIVLKHDEIRLHVAISGADGLALIRSLQPNLVILDLMLPGGLNGWQVYETIRADPDLRHIPVIVLTVVTARPGRLAALQGSDIDLYVVKPFDTLYLRRHVGRMLGQPDLWGARSASVARAGGGEQ